MLRARNRQLLGLIILALFVMVGLMTAMLWSGEFAVPWINEFLASLLSDSAGIVVNGEALLTGAATVALLALTFWGLPFAVKYVVVPLMRSLSRSRARARPKAADEY